MLPAIEVGLLLAAVANIKLQEDPSVPLVCVINLRTEFDLVADALMSKSCSRNPLMGFPSDILADFCSVSADYYCNPLVVLNSGFLVQDELPPKMCSFTLVMLPGDSLNAPYKTMKEVEKLKLWNRFASIVFVVQNPSRSYLKICVNFYRILALTFELVRSLLVKVYPTCGYLDIYSFNLFTETMFESSDVGWIPVLLGRDIFNDIEGFPFTVGRVNYYFYLIANTDGTLEGPFYETVVAFTKHINATLQWTQYVEDISVEDAYTNLMNERKVSFVPYIYVPGHEYINPPNFDGLCLLLSDQIITSYFEHLFVPFTLPLWISVMVGVTISIILNLTLPTVFPRNILATVFFGSVIAEHKQKRMERFAIFTIATVIFLLSEAYLAKMTAFMMLIKYHPRIQSLAEFEQSDVPLCYSLPIVIDYLHEFHPSLLKKVVSLRENPDHPYSNCSQLLPCELAYRTASIGKDPMYGLNKFYVMPQRVSWILRQSTIAKNSPLSELYQLIFYRLYNTGLWSYWAAPYINEIKPPVDYTNDLLSFRDLISLWWILVCGFLLSSLLLTVEILRAKRIKVCKRVEQKRKLQNPSKVQQK